MTMLGNVLAIRHGAERLDVRAAAEIAQTAWRHDGRAMVFLDLARTRETTTAALARLVLLRGRLLKAGRDLCIRGLAGNADALYHITRLEKVLPRHRRRTEAA